MLYYQFNAGSAVKDSIETASFSSRYLMVVRPFLTMVC